MNNLPKVVTQLWPQVGFNSQPVHRKSNDIPVVPLFVYFLRMLFKKQRRQWLLFSWHQLSISVSLCCLVTQQPSSVVQRSSDGGQSSDDGRPLMTPTERHMYAVKEMERVVHEFELFAESSCSAQELTGVIVQHVLKLTDIKRKVCCCLLVAWWRGGVA